MLQRPIKNNFVTEERNNNIAINSPQNPRNTHYPPSPRRQSSPCPTQAPSAVVQALSFYVGIPESGAILGHLSYCEATSPNLPPGRRPIICLLGVPKQLTYASFLADVGLRSGNVEQILSARTQGTNDRILSIKFPTQEAADNFYATFNRKHISSVPGNFYRAYFVTEFEFQSPTNEPTSCCICDEEHASHGVFTTLCRHTFHIKCMSSYHRIFFVPPADMSCMRCLDCLHCFLKWLDTWLLQNSC